MKRYLVSHSLKYQRRAAAHASENARGEKQRVTHKKFTAHRGCTHWRLWWYHLYLIWTVLHNKKHQERARAHMLISTDKTLRWNQMTEVVVERTLCCDQIQAIPNCIPGARTGCRFRKASLIVAATGTMDNAIAPNLQFTAPFCSILLRPNIEEMDSLDAFWKGLCELKIFSIYTCIYVYVCRGMKLRSMIRYFIHRKLPADIQYEYPTDYRYCFSLFFKPTQQFTLLILNLKRRSWLNWLFQIGGNDSK